MSTQTVPLGNRVVQITGPDPFVVLSIGGGGGAGVSGVEDMIFSMDGGWDYIVRLDDVTGVVPVTQATPQAAAITAVLV